MCATCVNGYKNNIKVVVNVFTSMLTQAITSYSVQNTASSHTVCPLRHAFTPGVWRTVLVRFSERTGQLLVSVQAKTKDLLATDDGAAVIPGGCLGWDSVELTDMPLGRLGVIAVVATATSREHMLHPTRNTT